MEFDKDGYNREYNIYKSFYYASKKTKNPIYTITDNNKTTRYKKIIKTIQIHKKTYYEIISLREEIYEKEED